MNSEDDFIIIGQILKPRGLKGELKVMALTGRPERFNDLTGVFIGPRFYEIENLSFQNRFVFIKFRNINDCDAAGELRGKYLEIPRAESYNRADDEYFYYEIEGLKVIGLDGIELGEITEIQNFPANDVYVVKTPDNREILVPAVKDVVVKIDLQNGTMTIDSNKGIVG